MKRNSKFLFIVIIILLLFIAISLLFVRQYSRLVKDDAQIINELGRVRGSIQRFVKLEIASRENQEAKQIIDGVLLEFEETEKSDMVGITKQWKEVQRIAAIYRADPSAENLKLLIKSSEESWKVAEQLVLANQLNAENSLSYLTLLVVFMLFEFIIVAILLYIVKKYVYDNLEASAIFDLLTGVYSRRYFFENLKREILRANRKDYIFSVIMFDIDHFKNVNDTYGHDKGDYVLKAIAQIVKETIRKVDVLSRIGGEEFTIILPEADLENSVIMAERVRNAVGEYIFDSIGKTTISLGVTQYNPDDNSDELLKRADNAMYLAKNNGRNCVRTQ